MDKRWMYLPEWEQMSSDQKQAAVLELLPTLPQPFQYLRTEIFSRGEISMETAVLTFKGREFVFVPGMKQASLGWQKGLEGLDEASLTAIELDLLHYADAAQYYEKKAQAATDWETAALYRECLSDYLNRKDPEIMQKIVARERAAKKGGVKAKQYVQVLEEMEWTGNLTKEERFQYTLDGATAYINENTSPPRTADIPPMLVEREEIELGFEPRGQINTKTRENNLSPEDFATIENYVWDSATKHHTREYNFNCRFVAVDPAQEIYDVWIYSDNAADQLVARLKQSGFILPNEDIWEYLCAGGSGDLFSFGNHIDSEWRYKNLNDTCGDLLEGPNQFGLYIASDQYQYEILSPEGNLLKGGDGGSSTDAGEPFLYRLLPFSPYWRQERSEYADYDGFLFYRRIFPLE